jgi:class 3 adenylate cyclase
MASQRRHLRTGLMLGAVITLLVAAADAAGWLGGLENSIYNGRARWCQVFSRPPTTQLVHLDIDDDSLKEIGVLPWPRTVMADVIDELRLLGARVIVLDIILPETQSTPGDPIDHDGNMAAAIARHGRVLVPVSLTIGKHDAGDEKTRWLVAEFEKDLESPLTWVEARGRERWGTVTENDVIYAREEATRRAVEREMAASGGALSADEVGQRLLPKTSRAARAGSEKLKDSVRAFAAREESRRALRRLAVAGGPKYGMPRATDDLPPVPVLARAAGYTGFVDHVPFDDGVVRAVPMWVEYRGLLFPFMGLRMACAMLDVPLERVRVEPDRVVVPRDDGTEVVLPATSHRSGKLGADVGMLLRVPWFGTDAWETMYDWPAHREAKQHVPFGLLWQAVKARRAAVRNNEVVDEALEQLARQSRPDEAVAFLASKTPVDDVARRLEVTAKVIKEFDDMGWVGAFREIKPEEMTSKEKSWIFAYDALVDARRANERAVAEAGRWRGEFEGKAILIGSVASGAADFVTTPLHAQCPGAVVHGAVFNAVMTGVFWRQAPGWANALVTVMVGLASTVVVGRLSPRKAMAAVAAVAGGYLLMNGYVVFGWGRVLLGAAGPVTAAAVVWSVVTVARYVVETAEAERIRGRFRQYVDDQLVDYVQENPDRDIFEGEERELTVAFTDMKGFTSLMERLGTRVVPVLNEYMGRMVPVIQRNGGYVNKFLGDGIMFFYGAPRPNADHAAHAVATVLEMRGAVAEFNAWLAGQGLEHVAVRAGVTTGLMIVGDAGSKRRSDYTVLGDSVNLASRLEGANKYFGTSVMISGRTKELLVDRFLVRPVGRVRVVGKREWVMAYEPLARRVEATDDQRELVVVTERMVGAFMAGQFEACVKAAEEGIERFGGQRLFEVYRELAGRHANGGVGPFDGVVELMEK